MKETILKNNNQRHPYHLVDPSPWPLLASVGGFGFNFWFCNGFAWFLRGVEFILSWNFDNFIYYVCLVERYCSWSRFWRATYLQCSTRTSTRSSIIHCVRDNVFLCLLLGFFLILQSSHLLCLVLFGHQKV